MSSFARFSRSPRRVLSTPVAVFAIVAGCSTACAGSATPKAVPTVLGQPRARRPQRQPRGSVLLASATMPRRRSSWSVLVASVAVAVLAVGCGSSGAKSSPTTSSTKPATSPTRQANSLLSPAQIKTLQTDLTTVRCFSGAIDGIIGPTTRAGITAFQQSESLTVNGQHGPSTKTTLVAATRSGTSVCTVAPATTTTTSSATAAACTSQTIQAALPAGDTVKDFGCEGEWAWALISVDPGPNGYDATGLLKANGTTWQIVDRNSANCNPSVVPPEIYNPGCTTN